jgi:putative addiction module component (TIGR02574 family)
MDMILADACQAEAAGSGQGAVGEQERRRRYTGLVPSDPRVFMAKPVPLPPPGFDDLSVDEKIDYVQGLWDRITTGPEKIPVPDWHHEIVHERQKDLEANPGAGDSWSVVQKRLRKKFDNRH